MDVAKMVTEKAAYFLSNKDSHAIVTDDSNVNTSSHNRTYRPHILQLHIFHVTMDSMRLHLAHEHFAFCFHLGHGTITVFITKKY